MRSPVNRSWAASTSTSLMAPTGNARLAPALRVQTCRQASANGRAASVAFGVAVGGPVGVQLRVDGVGDLVGVVHLERGVEHGQLLGEFGDRAAQAREPQPPGVGGFVVGLGERAQPADGVVEFDLAQIAGVAGGDGLGGGRGFADVAAAEVLDLADVDLVAFGLLDEHGLALHGLPHHGVVGGFGDVVEHLHLDRFGCLGG